MAAAARIVGVLLAAGRGHRYDPSGARLKLLQPAPRGRFAGQPVAVAAAHALRPAVDELIAVVAPLDQGAPQAALHASLADAGCRLVINPHADDGQGSSIACGVAAAPQAAGWLIALADMPAVAPATAQAVAAALRAGHPTAAPWHADRRGHPVGFGHALAADLLALSGDAGARSVLLRHPPHAVPVDDPGCLLDFDTPADFATDDPAAPA
jgi:molybdenum cofactor cytidylyltransferase